jgi:hypothetical protein
MICQVCAVDDLVFTLINKTQGILAEIIDTASIFSARNLQSYLNNVIEETSIFPRTLRHGMKLECQHADGNQLPSYRRSPVGSAIDDGMPALVKKQKNNEMMREMTYAVSAPFTHCFAKPPGCFYSLIHHPCGETSSPSGD